MKRIGRNAGERGWPGYLFGGHVRTSTAVLVLAFLGLWWVYDSNAHSGKSTPTVPASQVVPPGFVPDPNYTWVPRTRLRQPPIQTWTPTTTATTTTTPPPTITTTTTTTTPPPLVPPIVLPPLPPPFGPPPPPPAPLPEPAPGPAPPMPGS